MYKMLTLPCDVYICLFLFIVIEISLTEFVYLSVYMIFVIQDKDHTNVCRSFNVLFSVCVSEVGRS